MDAYKPPLSRCASPTRSTSSTTLLPATSTTCSSWRSVSSASALPPLFLTDTEVSALQEWPALERIGEGAAVFVSLLGSVGRFLLGSS
ncbi:hypothetical protein SORBI_3003G209300 [Sorghum bicolor]|uniref:Uncharacterized protein n=1 Tax=Sorghum bicolor TaxID=4558 RepID=A0A1B6Q4H4_SORBI|nr:hypothetical protein SORBI_3003G209300 [Sorghum bicolor]